MKRQRRVGTLALVLGLIVLPLLGQAGAKGSDEYGVMSSPPQHVQPCGGSDEYGVM